MKKSLIDYAMSSNEILIIHADDNESVSDQKLIWLKDKCVIFPKLKT